jgi:hypothetical protein
MSVIYFTNNAGSGDGSLVKAIENASPGDVICPDENVFERGSIVEIDLASTLTIDKTLTLDGGPYRVRLNGDGLARCCNVASGVNVEITSFDIVSGGWNSQTGLDQGSANGAGVSVAGDSSIVLKRCGFFGCRGSFGGGLSIAANATAELSDCVIVGCYARGSGAGLRSQGLTKVYSSTIIGNVGAGSTTAHDVLVDGSGRATFVNSIVRKCSGNVEIGAGCVVGVAPSQIGFVASPPDGLSAKTWDVDAWRNWDLHLLDDRSILPSFYRDFGDVEHMTRYDIEGNFRGRTVDGAATCSPGAYETIQADLFWVGKTDGGRLIFDDYWENLDGWCTSRFADFASDVYSDELKTVFVQQPSYIYFDEGMIRIPTDKSFFINVIIGGCTTIEIGYGFLYTRNTTIGACSSCYANIIAETARIGQGAHVGQITSSDGEVELLCDGDCFLERVCNVGKIVPANVRYGRLEFWRKCNVTSCLDGEYFCEKFIVYNNDDPSIDFVINSKPGTVIHAEEVQLGSYYPNEKIFTNPVDFKLWGDSDVKLTCVADNPDCDSSNDVAFDISGVWSVEFNKDFKRLVTLYGNNAEAGIVFSGANLKVDKRCLSLQSLTLNNGTTLIVDDGQVSAEALTLANSLSVVFSGVNAVLSASESATVGDVTLTGWGYFATPPKTNLTAAAFASDVRVCDYGADVETFSATASGKTVALEWNAENVNTPVLIERRSGDGWSVAANWVAGGSATVAVDTSGDIMFRIFDGEKFLLTSAYVDRFHAWLVYDNLFTSAVVVKSYKIVTEVVLMSVYFNANESPIFLARIVDSATSVPVAPSDVESIALTVYKQELYRGSKRKTELSGWVNVVVPTSTIKEELVVDDPRWKKDSVGYNFLYEPDLREKKLFAQAGEYVAIITVAFKEGNPAPLVFNVSVK